MLVLGGGFLRQGGLNPTAARRIQTPGVVLSFSTCVLLAALVACGQSTSTGSQYVGKWEGTYNGTFMGEEHPCHLDISKVGQSFVVTSEREEFSGCGNYAGVYTLEQEGTLKGGLTGMITLLFDGSTNEVIVSGTRTSKNLTRAPSSDKLFTIETSGKKIPSSTNGVGASDFEPASNATFPEGRESNVGFTANLPSGANLRAYPKRQTDLVVGIDSWGNYYFNATFIRPDQVESKVKSIFRKQTSERVVYLEADRNIRFAQTLTAFDLLARSGACVVALSTKQLPGTVSIVPGDNEADGNPAMRQAFDIQLPDPTSQNQDGSEARIVLEVMARNSYRINHRDVARGQLHNQLRDIFLNRPEKIIFVKGSPRTELQDVIVGIDRARGAGAVVIKLQPTNLPVPDVVPDIDLAKPATTPEGSPRCRQR